MRIRPSSISCRMVPSERTEWGSVTAGSLPAGADRRSDVAAVRLARTGDDRAHARGRGDDLAAVWAAARRAGQRAARMPRLRGHLRAAFAARRGGRLGLLLDRPPD